MRLSWKQYDLHLKHVFRISRSARDVAPIIIVELEHDGIIGIGESSPLKRYQETPDTVIAYLRTVDLEKFNSPFDTEEIMQYLEHLSPGNTSAKCAIDIALHDWIGKKLGVPLFMLWGLNPNTLPVSSFTIGIDTVEVVAQKVREAEQYPILKIKVGLDNDREMIETIRKITDKTIRVDANEGWKTKEIALERIKWLQDQNVEFVEQPMPAAQLEDIQWLREKVTMPLIADESVIRLTDLPSLSQAFDGINIKLMKCTGLREAQRLIHTARAHGMKIMLGCMIESSVAISAAAHLSPLVDYSDLDGNVLIIDDPFRGVLNMNGVLTLPSAPGLGVEKIGS
jgi:L-alanine-DL-glutamate epimerase-like enolase superfamily enzyme